MRTLRISALAPALAAVAIALAAASGARAELVILTDGSVLKVTAFAAEEESAVLVYAWARWRGIALFARDQSLRPGLLAGLLFVSNICFNFCADSSALIC